VITLGRSWIFRVCMSAPLSKSGLHPRFARPWPRLVGASGSRQ
jgi:hypothetical protein